MGKEKIVKRNYHEVKMKAFCNGHIEVIFILCCWVQVNKMLVAMKSLSKCRDKVVTNYILEVGTEEI